MPYQSVFAQKILVALGYYRQDLLQNVSRKNERKIGLYVEHENAEDWKEPDSRHSVLVKRKGFLIYIPF